jgi:Protein of unknown function (DUF2281)
MTIETKLYCNISKLSDELKTQVTDYVEFLLQKEGVNKRKPKPEFGSRKGLIGYMSDDFDEPLEDFKEYM